MCENIININMYIMCMVYALCSIYMSIILEATPQKKNSKKIK